MADRRQFVYLLATDDGRHTYVGATMDLDRRIRQHNKQLAGGAKQTSVQIRRGRKWTYVCYISGFPTWQSALQFEWRWKQLTRRPPKKPSDGSTFSAVERRLNALDALLELEKPTQNAIPYSEWPAAPEVNYCLHHEEEAQS